MERNINRYEEGKVSPPLMQDTEQGVEQKAAEEGKSKAYDWFASLGELLFRIDQRR